MPLVSVKRYETCRFALGRSGLDNSMMDERIVSQNDDFTLTISD